MQTTILPRLRALFGSAGGIVDKGHIRISMAPFKHANIFRRTGGYVLRR